MEKKFYMFSTWVGVSFVVRIVKEQRLLREGPWVGPAIVSGETYIFQYSSALSDLRFS